LKGFRITSKSLAAHYWTFLFHATPPRSQRTDYHRQSVSIVANFAALLGKCPVVWSRRPSDNLKSLQTISIATSRPTLPWDRQRRKAGQRPTSLPKST
jgi:hypothetical protein